MLHLPTQLEWAFPFQVQGELKSGGYMSKQAGSSSVSALALLSLGIWTGLGLVGSAAFAQDEGNEIVVTATRREQALQDVPIAVSAFNNEDLSRLNVTSTNDLQRIAPSLVISTSNSETGGSTLRIRGVGTTGNNAGLEGAVGVFIDGIYRQRAGLALQNLFDVARIEVLRGPQGTLFGKNTSAGALSVVPNLPSAEHEFSAQLTLGNYQNMDVQGMVNIPVNDQLAFRIAGAAQVRDGVMDGIIVNNSGVVAEQDFNNRDRELIRAMMLYEPSNTVSWRITADYADKDEACCATPYSLYAAANPSRRLAGGVGGVTIPASQFDRIAYVNEAPVERTEEWGVSSHLSIDLSDAMTLNTIAAYRRFTSQNDADVDFGPADILRQRIPATQELTSVEANLTGTAVSSTGLSAPSGRMKRSTARTPRSTARRQAIMSVRWLAALSTRTRRTDSRPAPGFAPSTETRPPTLLEAATCSTSSCRTAIRGRSSPTIRSTSANSSAQP